MVTYLLSHRLTQKIGKGIYETAAEKVCALSGKGFYPFIRYLNLNQFDALKIANEYYCGNAKTLTTST